MQETAPLRIMEKIQTTGATEMKLKGHKKSLHAICKTFLFGGILAVIVYLLMGCAGSPVKKLEPMTVDRFTVFCANEKIIKAEWKKAGGNPEYNDSVYAFVNLRWSHIYISCIEVEGLLLPEDYNALGHEVWHLINEKHRGNTMNPDDWRAR